LRFRHIERGGAYVRVADPRWTNPLDGASSAIAGGRWNAPGSFPVVYLFSDAGGARSFVIAKHRGLPYTVTDLRPERRPNLVHIQVRRDSFVDVITDAGCVAAGLPKTYPRDRAKRPVDWDRCRPAGAAAWQQGEPGIASRSASARRGDTGEELAWFQRRSRLKPRVIQRFPDWFAAIAET
jgi:hypothetical protein